MNKLKGGCYIGHDKNNFIVQILVNIQIFPLVGGTRLRLVQPTRGNICIYTQSGKLYISLCLFELGIPNSVCGCILGCFHTVYMLFIFFRFSTLINRTSTYLRGVHVYNSFYNTKNVQR